MPNLRDLRDLEKRVEDIPVKRISNLTKDIRKYEEHVNKCDIFETNTLGENIGSNLSFLKYTEIRTTEEQKQEIKQLEEIFINHMEKLRRCICVKKNRKII